MLFFLVLNKETVEITVKFSWDEDEDNEDDDHLHPFLPFLSSLSSDYIQFTFSILQRNHVDDDNA